jgi:fructokinase
VDAGICVFGEVLFDHFPDGSRVLGGAPFNVAWHLQALGQAPLFISRVGSDVDGDEVRAAMRAWGMDTRGLQIDPQRATGRVQVDIVGGEPRYEIVEDCAWDAIESSLVSSCDVLYHGSLAMRSTRSANSLQLLRDTHPGTVFIDVNLRPPWWQDDQLSAALADADWVKLNGDELAQLNPVAGADSLEGFLRAFGLQGVVVTRGAQGAEVLCAEGERMRVKPAEQTLVVDTVGAGDAFAAIMLLGLTQNWPVETTLQRAQQFAARLVGQRGATVQDPDFYAGFCRDWKLHS